ncbi:MAG: hypothetical protein J5507_00605 [Clostridia bacterium]|nr:hypothetical protein [Clostridia bacterium]
MSSKDQAYPSFPELSSDEFRSLIHNAMNQIVTGDGWVISDLPCTILCRYGQVPYQEFVNILAQKWHICVTNVEDEFYLLYIDTYDNAKSRLTRKAKKLIPKYKQEKEDRKFFVSMLFELAD